MENRNESFGMFLRKYLSLAVLTLLGYLLQVCVMPYLRVGGICANLLMTVIAIVVVAYGKLRAFWIGCIYGILLEVMLPSVSLLNLAMYPLITLFCSFGFADKSQQQLEYEKALDKYTGNTRPLLRTFGCATVMTTVYEVINIVYIYINGTAINSGHISRGIIDILYTVFLTILVMFPVRRCIFGKWDRPGRPRWLGKRKIKSVV